MCTGWVRQAVGCSLLSVLCQVRRVGTVMAVTVTAQHQLCAAQAQQRQPGSSFGECSSSGGSDIGSSAISAVMIAARSCNSRKVRFVWVVPGVAGTGSTLLLTVHTVQTNSSAQHVMSQMCCVVAFSPCAHVRVCAEVTLCSLLRVLFRLLASLVSYTCLFVIDLEHRTVPWCVGCSV